MATVEIDEAELDALRSKVLEVEATDRRIGIALDLCNTNNIPVNLYSGIPEEKQAGVLIGYTRAQQHILEGIMGVNP